MQRGGDVRRSELRSQRVPAFRRAGCNRERRSPATCLAKGPRLAVARLHHDPRPSACHRAGLVNNGAISPQLFNDTNGEHIGVFAKLEPLLGEIRAAYGPQFAVNFEKLIDATPDGRKRTTEARERIKAIRAQLSTRQAAAA